MSQNASRRIAGEDQDHVTASAKLIPFPGEHRPRPEDADAPADKPVREKRTRKAHPPVAHPVKWDGKAKESPHYIEPVVGRKFIEAMAEDDQLTPAGLRAAILVMGHYNHCEGVARPGEQGIANRLGKQRTTISEALTKVKERGWFHIIPTRIGNRNGPNHYVPILAKAGLRFGKTGRSGDLSVGVSEAHSRVSPALSVGFSEPSLSAKPDTNLDSEPGKVNPEKEPSVLAAAQQAGAKKDFPDDGSEVRAPSREPKIELPEGFQPDPVAVKAALDKGCTTEQIEQSLGEWRRRNAGKRFTVSEWSRKAFAWLDGERPKSKAAPDTMRTLLPADWEPTPEMISYVLNTIRLSRAEMDQAWSRFLNHYRSVSGFKALSRDWDHSWILWMQGAVDRKASQQKAVRSAI